MTTETAATRPVPRQDEARALLWMVLSSIAFSVMGVCMKRLGGELEAAEVVTFRCGISAVLTLIAMRRAGVLDRRSVLGADARSRWVLLLRAVSGSAALMLYVIALLRIAYAEAAALLYTSPLFTALFANLALGESVSRRARFALLLGFVGSALVLQPQLAGDWVGGVCALSAGVLSGVAYTSVRAASRQERGETIVLWFAAFGAPAGGLVACVDGFAWPGAEGWLWVLAMGVSAQIGQVLLTKSLASAPAGTAAVGAFATLALSAVWGYVLFAESLTLAVAAGSLCILGGILLASRRAARTG